jgi:hypothetical protein
VLAVGASVSAKRSNIKLLCRAEILTKELPFLCSYYLNWVCDVDPIQANACSFSAAFCVKQDNVVIMLQHLRRSRPSRLGWAMLW